MFKGITGWESYKRENALKSHDNANSCLKSIVCDRKLFNFKDYPRPKHSWEETIIYELHIKAFTESNDKDESCFKKFLKKIPYLKELGITTIELLPIFCFDPTDAPNGLKIFGVIVQLIGLLRILNTFRMNQLKRTERNLEN